MRIGAGKYMPASLFTLTSCICQKETYQGGNAYCRHHFLIGD